MFLTALGLAQAEREAYLREACPTEEARRRIQALLAHQAALTVELLDSGGVPARADPAPKRVEEFQILRRLGEGGMGVVYLAEDLLLGRRVALKLLAAHMADSEQASGRFRTEARAAAAVSHSAIVPVYRFGSHGGAHFIVSEFVDGPTLARVIEEEQSRRAGPVTGQQRRAWIRRSAEIVATLADGLEAAHRAGVIHRDVKPSNILLSSERGPRLTDFGIARQLDDKGSLAATTPIGTCYYMSPEQAAGDAAAVDRRSDIFSLGVVLFELLSLRRPFEGDSHAAVLKAVMEAPPQRLGKLDPLIPRDLEIICSKALEKRPADRYQSAGHVAADLRCFLEDRPILARPPSMQRRARHWLARHRLAVLLSACAALAMTLVVLASVVRDARRQRMAWLTIESDLPNLVAYAQRVNSDMRVEPAVTALGSIPLDQMTLEPGQYRITVAAGPDRFAEFNALLSQPGADGHTSLRVHGRGRTAAPAGNSDRVLEGWIASSHEEIVADMLLVPAGDYPSGTVPNDPNPLLRAERVAVPAFYIDRCEVSNREYRAFLDATGREEPWLWRQYGYDAGMDDLPVVNLSQEEMQVFARWRGKRLPTYHEWQAATRGSTDRPYPNGSDLPPGAAEVQVGDLRQLRSRDPAVHYGLYRRNTVGVCDLDDLTGTQELRNIFGNVRELTESLLASGSEAVVVGRAWSDPAENETLGSVWTYPRVSRDFNKGFRCARSAALPADVNAKP